MPSTNDIVPMEYSAVIPDSQPNVISLDNEILRTRQEIQKLSRRHATLTAALLISPSSQTLLDHARAKPPTSQQVASLERRIEEQKRQNMQNAYRISAGATMFETRDPDPNAVNGGRITGVRIEMYNQRTRTFCPPYYLLLNRPNSTSSSLRIHRHTIPPCIPLTALAAKYLPTSPLPSQKRSTSQNVPRFVQELHKMLISHHRRKEAVEKVAEELKNEKRALQGDKLKCVEVADADARILGIRWDSGLEGRVNVESNGRLKQAAVLGEDGTRRKNLELRILKAERIEGLGEVLMED